MEVAATVCCAAASASVSRVKSGLAARSSGFSLQVASGSVDTTKKSTFSLYMKAQPISALFGRIRGCVPEAEAR